MKFPEKYIREGEFKLHSGRRSKVIYDVEWVLTDDFFRQYLFYMIPKAKHYVGIATGGMMIAIAMSSVHLSSKFSYVNKKGVFVGERPKEDWMLIDDVTTTGNSLQEAIIVVGSLPSEIIVAVDRRKQRTKIDGIEVKAIFDV